MQCVHCTIKESVDELLQSEERRERNHLTESLPVPETTLGIMSRSGKRLRTGEEEGEGEEEDGDFDPMAFYRWILTVAV